MKILNVLLVIAAFSSFSKIHAQSDFEIRIAQNSYVKNYQELTKYIGSDNTDIFENEITYSSSLDDKMIINFAMNVKEITSDRGQRYYNVKTEGYIIFDDIDRAYVQGDRIVLEMNSNGYANKIKVQGESWTDMIKNHNDFYLTVKDEAKRDEVLRIIKMLMKYPVYRKKS